MILLKFLLLAVLVWAILHDWHGHREEEAPLGRVKDATRKRLSADEAGGRGAVGWGRLLDGRKGGSDGC